MGRGEFLRWECDACGATAEAQGSAEFRGWHALLSWTPPTASPTEGDRVLDYLLCPNCHDMVTGLLSGTHCIHLATDDVSQCENWAD